MSDREIIEARRDGRVRLAVTARCSNPDRKCRKPAAWVWLSDDGVLFVESYKPLTGTRKVFKPAWHRLPAVGVVDAGCPGCRRALRLDLADLTRRARTAIANGEMVEVERRD